MQVSQTLLELSYPITAEEVKETSQEQILIALRKSFEETSQISDRIVFKKNIIKCLFVGTYFLFFVTPLNSCAAVGMLAVEGPAAYYFNQQLNLWEPTKQDLLKKLSAHLMKDLHTYVDTNIVVKNVSDTFKHLLNLLLKDNIRNLEHNPFTPHKITITQYKKKRRINFSQAGSKDPDLNLILSKKITLIFEKSNKMCLFVKNFFPGSWTKAEFFVTEAETVIIGLNSKGRESMEFYLKKIIFDDSDDRNFFEINRHELFNLIEPA